jgi:hypothetical protein
MTEPTTPTGQLTVEHFDAALPINAGPNRILAIEQEAAAAERAQMTPYLEAALDDADRLADALTGVLPFLPIGERHLRKLASEALAAYDKDHER